MSALAPLLGAKQTRGAKRIQKNARQVEPTRDLASGRHKFLEFLGLPRTASRKLRAQIVNVGACRHAGEHPLVRLE
jgi:hypothetical protein